MAPYFSLTLAAGHSAAATAIVSNTGGKTETLTIGRSVGITAANGGSAYSLVSGKCAGVGCWLTGLPRQVTLPGHTHERLHFTVAVPAGTAPGQYLGGIAAESAARPPSRILGSNGKAEAGAIIVEQVTVGVAVTVGHLSKLATRLRIPGVLGAVEGPVARLGIQLDNTGQTFAKGNGEVTCITRYTQHTYTVSAGTVLPHDHALIAVNAPGLPEGATLRCQVQIRYGTNQTLGWAGRVAIPAAPSSHIVHTGPGAYSTVPDNRTPTWAIVLISIGILILGGFAVLLFRSRRPSYARW
jgi:hypothetical protein